MWSSRECAYVFVQGPKKGTQCGTLCRGKYCFKHKPKNIEHKKKYYKEHYVNRPNALYNRIKEMISKGDTPDVNVYRQQQLKLEIEGKMLLQQILGIQLFLGMKTYDEIEKRHDHTINRRFYDDMDRVFAGDEYKHKTPDELELAKQNYLIEFQEFKKPLIIPYKGNSRSANKRLKTLLKERDTWVDKRKEMHNIIHLLETQSDRDIIEV